MAQPQATSIPYNGSGTINIHINNPSANMGTGMPQAAMTYQTYPVYYPYFTYPPNYYLGGINNGGINQTTNINTPMSAYPTGVNGANNANGLNNANGMNNPGGYDNQLRNVKNISNMTNQTNVNQKQREVVVLTDNYVKNLENYLRSNNIELRKNAIKEVLSRFKEDKSRIDNPSLTALLNIALQDTNSTVRGLAMTILEAGYAKGNAQTEQILKQIQTQKKNFSSDAVQATDSLLQMSKTKKLVPDNSHYKDQPSQPAKGE